MSGKHPTGDPDLKATSEYQLGKITVEQSDADNPAEYRYSDLRQGSRSLMSILIHSVHWPLYFFILFPLQYIVRIFRWSFRLRHYSPAGRFAIYLSEMSENLQKLRFLANYDRFILYLRASRVLTPAQIFPFIPGTAPISSSRNTAKRQTPNNWKAIRQSVYQRDNYQCVNCGAAGGPHGDTELHADHVLPRSKNGADEPYNLRTLCRPCHEARHARIFN